MFSECYVFEPPNPIRKSIYKCDKKFHLDDLIELYMVLDTYAIVLVSGKRTDIYTWSKNNICLIKSITINLPNQHKAGGQSAPRFGRIRDEKIALYIKRIAELMVLILTTDNIFGHLGLILAGPSQLKDQLKSTPLFVLHFEKYLFKTITIGEINDQSINQVIDDVAGLIYGMDSDSQLIEKFESMLSNSDLIELIVFGIDDVIKQYTEGTLAELYIDANNADILDSKIKTKINLIQNKIFIKKYGIAVGIKYYATEFDPPIDEIEI